MHVRRAVGVLLFALLATVPARASEPPSWLARGICIDRQVRTRPPEAGMRIAADDLRQIKTMGFGFVKLLVNPAVVQSGRAVDTGAMAYFDRVIADAAEARLPVVVCIHPEDDFKRRVLGHQESFETFLAFMASLGRHLATRWSAQQLALQIMTEPYGGSSDPTAWNRWDRLQHRLWSTLRRELPDHTLILSADRVGSIEGLDDIEPVNDANVLYSFTFYEPHLFTWQGGNWRGGVIPVLKDLPYPARRATPAEVARLVATMPESLRRSARSEIEQYAAEGWNRDRLAARIDQAVAWQRRCGARVRLWCAEFGCYQVAAPRADRLRYLFDMRSVFEDRGIGWAYWSYNETFTVMTADSKPFWPPTKQTPDTDVLRVLLPGRP